MPRLIRSVSSRVSPARHRDSLGHLCLYTARDHDGQPWLDADAFLARIKEWFAKNDAGWPDDPPALDLEAYLNQRVLEYSAASLEDLHELRLAVRDRVRALGEPDLLHVQPWVWNATTTDGKALTAAGGEVGYELRLSWYAAPPTQ